MVQLVFMRLPQFPEDTRIGSMKHLKMKHGIIESSRVKRKVKASFRKTSKDHGIKNTSNKPTGRNQFLFHHIIYGVLFVDDDSPPLITQSSHLRPNPLSTTPMTPGGNIVDMQGSISQHTPQSCVADANSAALPSSFSDQNSELDGQADSCSPNSDLVINVQSPSSLEEYNVETGNEVGIFLIRILLP